MRPKFTLFSAVVGLLGFTWFGKLNASARNCSVWFSEIWNVRVRPISIRMIPGPRMFPAARFPYVPAAGAWNAAGFSQRVATARNKGLPLITSDQAIIDSLLAEIVW